MSAPALFTPAALAKAPIVRETRLTRDLTMPVLDLKRLDAPAHQRLPARSVVARSLTQEISK